ncbi:MAG: cysteine desulfurase [Clostridia bacterium]|nr:cysteine desulfurase [Clostridia bacterium]MBR3180905.1 cysteine desulfurase [Candidatus Saccharibacteria bacterium]
MIYLDFSATSPLLPCAKSAILKVMELSETSKIGNPSSLHSPGSLSRNILENARKTIAKKLNARTTEIIFTSGGSEANNTVINIFRNSTILASRIEHPSVLKPTEKLGNPCIKIPVSKEGFIDKSFLKNKLETFLQENPKEKILISVMMANNEIGTLEPIKALSKTVEEYRNKGLKNLFLHTDATQAFGKINIDVKKLKIDYMTISAHKIGGPVGIGALFLRSGTPFAPLILGGSQENNRRAGTSNALLAEGFRSAVQYTIDIESEKLFKEKITPLKDFLAKNIKKQIPSSILLTPNKSLPNILSFSFPAAEGESTQLYLDLENIAVSTGSACASGDLEPSHVIMATHNDAEIAHNSVRFSLGLDTQKSDIDILLDKLPPIINRLQKISTIKTKDVK